MQRIGIYAGTFNPVHAGHLSFALQAIHNAQLDVVYFLPERRPRSKIGVEHFGHRVAMLQKAVRPHRRLKLLELEDVSLSVAASLPRLHKRFKNAQLVFLVGSDVAARLPQWSNVQRLLASSEFVVGLRCQDSHQSTATAIRQWPIAAQATYIIASQAPAVSSEVVRQAIRERRYTPGLLKSVERYSGSNWLYVSLA